MTPYHSSRVAEYVARFLAIPLHKGQLSCREVMNGETLVQAIKANDKLTIEHVDGPYSRNDALNELILNRGL